MHRWRERTFVIEDDDGSVRVPADSELLARLYGNIGVRVRVVRRVLAPVKKTSGTVGQLIEELSKSKRRKGEELWSLQVCGSSSTPTATFPGSDLLYGSDGLPRPAHGSDDLGGSDISGYERDRQRLRDLEIGNKRPSSRSKRPTYAVVDKVSFDRERDDVRSVNNSMPVKAPVLRSNGLRNSLVRGEQLLSQRSGTASNSGRESDDLIAMGTLWSPAANNNNGGSSSNGNTRSSSNTTSSNKSVPAINNNNNNLNNNNSSNNTTSTANGGAAGGGPISHRKPISVAMTSNRLGHSSSFNGLSCVPNKINNKEPKEVEPKYGDPLVGAPASFQQRLMELAALEAETIRWERIKKVKKKPKQDRDS